jgi:alkylation response protein AidB-like acyl-CoA dehydrogenase
MTNTRQDKPDLGQEEAILAQASTGNKETKEALEIAEEAREKYTLPSFGSELFMGNFKPDLIFPYPEQSPEDKKIGDDYIRSLTHFLTENLDPEEVDRTREIPKAVIDGLVKLGAFALKVPKEYGGLGFSQTNYNRIIQIVASYCGSTAVLLSAHQSIGVPQPLKMFGTEEQKKKFFPRFRTGSISAFALTEPDVGSDPAQMSTEAKLSEDGTHYILNGIKLWCTNGTIADIIIVMAKTAPKIVKGREKKQISAFILEMNTPGVEVIQRCEFMGLAGIYNGMIKFTNVRIPKENLLWEEGRGLAMALATINVGRLTLPAASVAAAKQCLHICRKWGKSRVQWGMPVGQHEAGAEKIAWIAATTFAMEAITWLTSSWQDQGKIDIRIEAAMAKYFASESLWKISDMTMQLRGGRGYEKARSLKARGEPAYPVERIMRDNRINMILEGSSEIMRLFLAREAMDPHLKRAQPLLNPKSSFMSKINALFKCLNFYSIWYPSQWLKNIFPPKFKDMGPLANEFTYIHEQSHVLARHIFGSMAKYQQHLEKKQQLLGRLVDIGTDLFAMSCTCAYAKHLVDKNPGDKTPYDLAEYFCRLARRRIEKHQYALEHNFDKQGDAIAQKVLNDQITWLEKGVIPLED